MSRTFDHRGRKVDFDLWQHADVDMEWDFDAIAAYMTRGVMTYIPEKYLSSDVRAAAAVHLEDESDTNWGVIIGLSAVVVVNVVGVTLVAAGALTGNPALVTAGSALLAIPDIVVYAVAYTIGSYLFD